MKSSVILGIIGGAFAIIIGLFIIIPTSITIYKNNNLDYDEYYLEAIENSEEPVHFESFGWQTFIYGFLRVLGCLAFVSGAFGLTGGLLGNKKRSAAYRFLVTGAVFGILSFVGIVSAILLFVGAVQSNKEI